MEMSVREFIANYENGKYEDPSVNTMIDAGWFDWFCEDDELKSRLDEIFPKVKQLASSSKVNIDTMYVFFKNNCPGIGDIYDDFRFCEMRTGIEVGRKDGSDYTLRNYGKPEFQFLLEDRRIAG
ncbi:MAG: hypothetical protein LBH43_01560 [Treponema sp.]|jgi:hypothetical protein|nr:hypothetical protein [Treponema sp.]